jgi:hypothetical protein
MKSKLMFLGGLIIISQANYLTSQWLGIEKVQLFILELLFAVGIILFIKSEKI